jgi:hypothetical protein
VIGSAAGAAREQFQELLACRAALPFEGLRGARSSVAPALTSLQLVRGVREDFAMGMHEYAYFRALQTTLHGAALPYGYAITVWSAGAALAGAHGGGPTSAEILLFALGATSAYSGLKLVTWETDGEAEKPLAASPRPLRAGLVHLVAITAAIVAALVIAEIPGSVAWVLAPLAATVIYLSVSSVEVAAVERGGGASLTEE